MLLKVERGNLIIFPKKKIFWVSISQDMSKDMVSLGYWKKRMPSCNGWDTGCNITWHENELTSNWSFFAREIIEPF
jgi:hypothetical protein